MEIGKIKESEKNNEYKDDIRSLNGLKIERLSMQKLEESCYFENLGKS